MRSSVSSATMACAIFFSAATSSSTAFQYSAPSPTLSAAHTHTPSASCRLQSTQLNAAAASQFSELDKLRAKRLSLRRPSSPPPPSAADVAITDEGSQQLEYLYDKTQERHDDDFFHVILMPSTFTKKQLSIEQATTSLLTTLSSTTLPTSSSTTRLTHEKAHALSLFAKHQGFSVIGTWTREDCLVIGEELVREGLDCRVIPYNSALPSTSVPVVVSGLEREEEVVGRSGDVEVVTTATTSSSFGSDYLLSLSR